VNHDRADYICDGVNDHIEIQAALDALPATGGCISLLDGTYALGAQVARAIDDVKFIGCGASTLINFNGINPVITAGAQDGWLFSHFATDAGGVDIAGATQSAIRSVWIAGVRTDDPAGAGGDAVITVAASNTPAAQKGRADFVCGGANDDATIEALVAAGVTVKLMVGGYVFGATLDILVSNFRLEGSGWGTVISGAIGVAYIKVGDGSTTIDNVTICDLKIDGSSQTGGEGIYLQGSGANALTNIQVLHCRIDDADEEAIKAAYIFNSLFDGNYTDTSGKEGIVLLYSYNCKTANNHVYHPTRAGISMGGSGHQIIDNYIDTPGAGYDGILLGASVTNTSVVANIVKDAPGNHYAVWLDRCDHCVIANNIANSCMGGCVSLDRADDNSILGNNADAGNVVLLDQSHHNTITGNHSRVCSSIFLTASTHNVVSSNISYNDDYGVRLEAASDYNVISENDLRLSNFDGIRIADSHHNIVENNLILESSQGTDNTGDGIEIHGSDYNLVQGNLVRQGALAKKTRYGISIDAGSDHNTVRDNDLYDSGQTGPILDNGVDTKFNNITFQFIQGTLFISATGSAKGWEIDLANEWAIALGQLPLELTQVVRIKIWAVGLAAPGAGNGMLIDVNMNAGQDDEAYTAEAVAVVAKGSATLNFAVNDVIHWVLTSADDANIGTMTGGDSLELQVLFKAAVNGDIDTDAVFRAVEIEYVT